MPPLLKYARDIMAEVLDQLPRSHEEEEHDDRMQRLYKLVKHRLTPPPTRH